MYTKIESERLQFLRASQTKLRAENYNILHDAIQADADPTEMIKRVILPASLKVAIDILCSNVNKMLWFM